MTPDTELSKPNCTLDSSGKKNFSIDCRSHPWISESGSLGGILDSFNHTSWWSLPARSAESGLNSLANTAVIISSVSQMEQRLLTPKSPWNQYSLGPVRTRWGKPRIPGAWERPQRRHFVSEDPERSRWRSARTASVNRVNVFPTSPFSNCLPPAAFLCTWGKKWNPERSLRIASETPPHPKRVLKWPLLLFAPIQHLPRM